MPLLAHSRVQIETVGVRNENRADISSPLAFGATSELPNRILVFEIIAPAAPIEN
jgi:hypothetical protein